MPRIRSLKPEFFFDDELAELPFACRLLFQGLWCYADKEGRLENKPKVLKAQIFPFDSVKIENLLDRLSDKFITQYEVKGRKYIQVNTFSKHQKPHHTEKESVIPECNGYITVKERLKTGGKDKDYGKDKDIDKDTAQQSVDRETIRKSFDKFWEFYPKKVGKDKAFDVWSKNKFNDEQIVIILEAVIAQSNSIDWKKDNGQFIPHPTTWLNQGRWKDG